MNKASGRSDSVAQGIENSMACPQCGASTQSNHGTCINCLLLEGLEAEGESSSETFERILAEADVPDKQWRLGHYEILEEIGRGGMGVIYRARQQHSRRIVAVKRVFAHEVDSRGTLVRFRREAEAVASLDHPNILPIHEVSESEEGLPFFSMKYATGGSLRTAAPTLRKDPRECVQLMAKVAHAIAYAHSKGVLHRDLQPGNILLDENGEPMVSDFGLAKWLNETSDLTRTLETLGTPGYIAPEQAECRASQLTDAADTYSLGAILFYLLTGRPPFVGPNVLCVIHQASAAPAPHLRSLVPSLDRDLERIVDRCLESDPKARYQSAGALAEDLEHWLRHEPIRARHIGVFTRGRKWVRRNPTSALLAASLIALAAVIGWNDWKGEFVRSPVTNGIAVLPFENLSADPDNAYFAEGIQDEILTRLASIAGLKVISRTSTQHYPNKPRNLSEIAKQLGVANILEGSVQKTADQVRVNVQLINAQTDSHLWAETYDRKLTDIFGVESEIAKQIAESLQAKITGREEQALAVKSTNNPEAYDAYLRALALVHFESDYEALERALQTLKQAVDLDPNFAAAWALLARIQAQAYSWGSEHTKVDRTTATKALETAVRLQPELAEVQMAQGYYQYYILRDWNATRQTFEGLGKRWPNNADIVTTLGLVAEYQGRWTEALKYHDDAIALSPRDLDLRLQACLVRYYMHDFTEALRMLDQVLNIWPGNTNAILQKVEVYQALGQLDQAQALLSGVETEDLLTKGGGVGGFGAMRIRDQALLSRDPASIVRAITFFRKHTDPPNSLRPVVHAFGRAWLGRLEQLSGQANEARAHFMEAREEFEQQLKQQEHQSLLQGLAEALAGLGEREAALRETDLLVERVPSSSDAISGPWCEEYCARTQARFGDADRAIPTLKRLLKTNYSHVITPALLRLHPDFDPLRNDPRFQKLCEETKPVALK